MGDYVVKVRKDLTGCVFGRLTVVAQAEDYIQPNGTHCVQWLCRCSCTEHNMVVVKGSNLNGNKTLSCGCLARERAAEIRKKYNKYSDKLSDEYGEYYIGYTSNTNKEFYVDAIDFDIIKDYCWYEHHPQDNFTTMLAYDKLTKRKIKMHQLLGCSNYDHVDRNELNNRRYNLRLCTQQTNTWNSSIRTNNTSGVIGVCWSKNSKKWVSRICFDGKDIGLGYFVNFDEAVRARLQAEVQYYGAFAPQKHLYEQYGINTSQ